MVVFFNDMGDEVHEPKILRFPHYRHICLRIPGKCASNALIAQLRYWHTFSVYQRCAYNKCLLYHFSLFCFFVIPIPEL